jgi:hypothetical protein
MLNQSKPPSNPPPEMSLPKMRRQEGGARVRVSKHVVLNRGPEELEGWVLNVSRGGMRLITEENLDEQEVIIVHGFDYEGVEVPGGNARVVWVRREPDGMIAGLEFLDQRPSSARIKINPRQSQILGPLDPPRPPSEPMIPIIEDDES